MDSVRRVLDRAAHSPYGLLLLVGAVVYLIPGSVPGLAWPLYGSLYILSVVLVGIGGAGVGLTDQAEAAKKQKDAEARAGRLDHEAELARTRMLAPYGRMRSFYRAIADMQSDLVIQWQEMKDRYPSTKVDWTAIDKALTVLSTDINHFVREYEDAHEEWRSLLPDELAKLDNEAPPPRSAEIDRHD